MVRLVACQPLLERAAINIAVLREAGVLWTLKINLLMSDVRLHKRTVRPENPAPAASRCGSGRLRRR